MCIWDVRSGKIETQVSVSDKEIYSIAINPVNKNLILTGG
jgi:WD40 repeat protein